MFILAGSDIETRLHVMRIFRSEHFLFREGVLKMEDSNTSEPSLSAQLVVTRSFLRLFLWNEVYHPDFGPGFPAKRLSTHLEWKDLVLPEYVLEELDEIKAWITHESTIQKDWQLEKWIKPGYRCLFFGPPGTGKTLTASLLGKELKQEVYRVDLSMVVSKYIGETEKNLAGVFDQAENQNWILFFDEADALFGKRTETQSSHDRYANQEVSYLLQRVEDYDGLVILASNFKGNLDEAFIRRFQAMIHFPVPGPEQRLRLWQKMFTENFKLSPEVDLGEIAERYEISGGEIVNILRTLAIRSAQQKTQEINAQQLIFALRKEYRKSGKIITN
jgi:SpoVK/Ycf46/Vps4 family AAA+-type ATPase